MIKIDKLVSLRTKGSGSEGFFTFFSSKTAKLLGVWNQTSDCIAGIMSIVNHLVRLEDHASYLKWFGTGAIRLIYAKKPSISSNSKDGNLNSDIDLETSVEDCDLTGQPLYVDLGDNSNNAIGTLTQQSHDNIWPKDELRHFPLPVREARKILNNILREGKIGASQPCYVLCAGDDSSNTVLLGANISDYMGCSVQLLKPLPADKVESSLEDMVRAHLRYCFNNNSQIKYLVKMYYNVYGRNIEKTTDQQVSKLQADGNISVDITALKNIFRPCKNSVVDVTMNVSVVVGHPHLKLSFIWQQLLKLQRTFSILSDSNFGTNEGKVYQEISLCDAPLDMDDIFQSITKLVSLKEFYPIKENNAVDLNDLRHLDILDRLWDLLSCCGNVSELKDSFSFLFSELLEIRSDICLVDVSDNIGILIKRILEGHRGMPKNSVKQCLEFLFELGARKLKLDFQTIISQFPGFDKTHVDCISKSFFTSPSPSSTTFNKSIVEMQEQLAYLCQLYVASELFYLVKEQVNMSEDGYEPLCKSIEQEYILDTSKITDFKEIIITPLRAINFNLDINYASFIDSMLPSQWTLTMESGRETTIYHLSSQPIYPPQIITHVPHPDINGPFFYVTKMNRSYAKLD